MSSRCSTRVHQAITREPSRYAALHTLLSMAIGISASSKGKAGERGSPAIIENHATLHDSRPLRRSRRVELLAFHRDAGLICTCRPQAVRFISGSPQGGSLNANA